MTLAGRAAAEQAAWVQQAEENDFDEPCLHLGLGRNDSHRSFSWLSQMVCVGVHEVFSDRAPVRPKRDPE